MLKVLLVSFVLVSTSFAADEFDPKTAECVNKVSQAMGLTLGQEHSDLKLSGGGCALEIWRGEGVSGLNNLPDVELRMWGDNGSYFDLNANEGLKSANVSKCEVKADSITLKYSGKVKTGWGGSYSSTLKFTLANGKVTGATLLSKSGGWMSGSDKNEFSCKFSN